MVLNLPAEYINVEDDPYFHTSISLQPDVERWLQQKCPNEWQWRLIDKRDAFIIIHNEKVAMEFKLTWL